MKRSIWKQYLHANIDVTNPIGNGWIVMKHTLDIDWMSLPATPTTPTRILELLKSNCSKKIKAMYANNKRLRLQTIYICYAYQLVDVAMVSAKTKQV